MKSVTSHFSQRVCDLRECAQNFNVFDLPTFTNLFPILDDLCLAPNTPSAFKSQCDRIKKMIETAILGDAPLETTIIKLRDVITKMVKTLEKHPDYQESELKSISEITVPHQQSQENIELDSDLVKMFITNQKSQLDDFEVYVLEVEKGNNAAKEALRRYLHTLKGEFGVLDLSEYAELVHDLEGIFAANKLTMDQLLRFKDWLCKMFPTLAEGKPIRLLAQDYESFGIVKTNTDVEQQPLANTPSATTSAESKSESIQKKINLNLDPSFFADFITESREHIHTMETRLLDLEADPTAEDPINAIFRGCHTIKGLAGFLDLSEVQKVAHAMESVMDKARNHQFVLSTAHTDLLLASSDCIKDLVNRVEASLRGEDIPLPANYEEINSQLLSLDIPDSTSNIQAAPLARIGEILVDSALVPATQVEDALDKQKHGDARRLGEILMVDEGISPRILGQALGAQVQAKQQAQLQSIEESVRVPVIRLDQLIDAIGEAVIAQSMIVADSVISDLTKPATPDERDALRRKVARAELIMRQIQELSMSLRMVSVKAVFQKMARLARDLSKKLEKRVDLVMEGENTELDKSVVENIGDPLVHMVRNALDHGIETTQERRAAGKPDVARVVLRAFHKAGNIFIEIEDDGRGISRERVIKKAVSQGLIASGTNISDHDVFQLLFRPGFSTAAQVTDVSGRGVGMDVVKRNIEALRGSIDITSEEGHGSKFSIRLPLTLAIIDGMVIRVGVERFILPTLQVIETLKPKEGQIESVLGKGEIIHVRKDIVRVVRLSKVLGAKSSFNMLMDGVVVIVEDASGARCGIAADEILDQQQVVIKNIGGGMGEVPGIAGGAIMNSGEVSLILDVSGIVRLSKDVINS